MTRATVVGALLACLAAPLAAACPEEGGRGEAGDVLFHSCWGPSAADILLLPEDMAEVGQGEGAETVTVTGAYTGKDERSPGVPAPVGLLMVDGEVIGRHAARMDGVLLIDPARHRLGLYRVGAVPVGGETYDLIPLDKRQEFFRQAGARNISLLQSHLLVIEGLVDTSPVEGAPASVRRIFFTDGEGFGLWQSHTAMTLDEAARAVAAELAPRMALNLDMGSFDFCLLTHADGREELCGTLSREGLAKLSNLLVLTRR